MYSQTAEYALRAMACLALSKGELVATPVLAERTKVPANYLAKVLQQLAAAELITGRRGVGGGYRLSKPAAQINLLDVVNAVSSVKRIESCPLELKSHGANLCPLHRRLDEAAAAVIDIFSGVTLLDLIEDETNPSKPLCEASDVGATAGLTIEGSGLGGS